MRTVPGLLRTGLFAALMLTVCRDGSAQQPYSDARFWRVERGGVQASFVLGTMHVTDPEVTVLSPEIARAFDGSRALAVELTMDAATQAALAGVMMTSDLDWIERRLDSRQRELLSDAAGQYQIDMGQLRMLEPWAVAAMFSFPPAELQRQMAGEQPLDMRLMDRAEAAGMKLIALEQVGEQIKALTDYSQPEQIQLLTLTLESVSKIESEFERLKDAYLAGDLAGVSAIADEGFAALDPALAAQIVKRLVVDRNRNMAGRLEPLLDQGGLFVAIGALHLPGEAGVLNLLAQRGYRITAVE